MFTLPDPPDEISSVSKAKIYYCVRYISSNEIPRVELLIVNRGRTDLSLYHLRREVVQGAAECLTTIGRRVHGPPEVRDLQLQQDESHQSR